jgi:hypothetical protein
MMPGARPISVRTLLVMDFVHSNGLWWPFHAVSKALLWTQRNASDYLDANRRLIDASRCIVQREQDLVWRIAQSSFEAVSKSNAACRKQFDLARCNAPFALPGPFEDGGRGRNLRQIGLRLIQLLFVDDDCAVQVKSRPYPRLSPCGALGRGGSLVTRRKPVSIKPRGNVT